MKKIKRQATDWERIYETHVSNKGLAPKIYKRNPYSSALRGQKTQLKWAKVWADSSLNLCMINKQKKGCSTSLVIKEIQTKAAGDNPSPPLEWQKWKSPSTPKVNKFVEQLCRLYHGWKYNITQSPCKNMQPFLVNLNIHPTIRTNNPFLGNCCIMKTRQKQKTKTCTQMFIAVLFIIAKTWNWTRVRKTLSEMF